MADVILLKRAAGKAHLTSLVENTDDAVVSSLVSSSAGTGVVSLYNEANTTSITVGGSAQTTGSLFDGAAMTGLTIGAGMGAGDNITLGGSGSTVTVSGDLVVNGTTTSVDSEVVNIADNHMYLNDGYTAVSAQTGGLVVNYLPTAVTDTVAGGAFESSATSGSGDGEVEVADTTGFAVGDFIQVSGANNQANDGLYEVAALLTTPARLQIRGVTTATVEDFTQTDFTTDATVAGTITKVNISVMRAGTDGLWEVASGSSTGLTFADLGTAAGTDLQTAYDNSSSPATITTDATTDGIIVTGTAGFQVTATGVDAPSTGFAFEVDTTAAYRMLADAASTISVDGASLTLSTTTSGSLIATSAGLLDMNAGANMDIDVTGTYDMLATGAFSIDGTGASNVTATSGALTLSTATSGDVIVSAASSAQVLGAEAVADAVDIQATNAAGGINVDAGTGGIAVDTTGALSLDSTGTASNLSLTANDAGLSTLTIASTNAGAGDGDLDINVDDTLTVDAGDFSIDGTAASNVSVTGADLTLSTLTSGNLVATAAGNVDVDSGATGSVTVDAGTGGLSLDTTGTAANLTQTANAAGTATLTISTTNAGAGAANLDIDAEDTITVDGASLSLDATLASNFTVTANSGSNQNLVLEASNVGAGDATLIFDGNSMTTPLPFNGTTAGDTGDQDLSSNFTATTLVGALNELKEGGAQGVVICDKYTTTGRTVGEAVIADGNDSAATAADASALSTSEGFAGIVHIVGGTGVGEVCTSGTVEALFENGIATPAAGDPIYLSETAGRVTGTAPSGTPQSGIVIYQIGVLRDASTLTAGTTGTDELAEILLSPVQLIEL